MLTAPPLPAMSQSPRMAQWARLLVFVLVVGVTVLLTYRLARVGGYPLTLAPFALLALIGLTLRPQLSMAGLWAILFAWVYPLIVGLLETRTDISLSALGASFVTSYMLWVVSSFCLIATLTLRLRTAVDLAPPAFAALTLIVMFAVVQAALANVGGSTALYTLFGGAMYGGAIDPLDWERNGLFRAVGFYYEPSMLGRVSLTLAIVCLLAGYRPVMVALLMALVVGVTQSPGTATLFGLAWAIASLALNRDARSQFGVLLVAVMFAVVTMVAFADRLAELSSDRYVSGYVRMVAPLLVLADLLPDHPFGLILGSNEVVVPQTDVWNRIGSPESRITNGVYELMLYGGVTVILLLLGLIATMLYLLAAGRWRLAIVVLNLLLGTVVSSSFLSLESTLLSSLIAIQARAMDTRPPLRPPPPGRGPVGLARMRPARRIA